MAGVTRLTVPDTSAGERLDRFIAAQLPDLSRSQVQRLLHDGRVTVSKGHAKPGLVLDAGVEVTVDVPAPRPASPIAQALPLDVVYDDADVVVVNKPAGMVVHPAAGHTDGTLVNALLHHVRGLSGIGGTERPGIVHRLDRGTSGLMVVAKHDRAHRAIAQQFHDRQVRKEYVALVWGQPASGTHIESHIGRDPNNRQRMSGRARHGRLAVTDVMEVEAFRGVSLTRLLIGTGRTHQIRVHLSELGFPLVGDALYGGARKRLPTHLASLAGMSHPFLHAARLAFTHPVTGAALDFQAPLPQDLARVVKALRQAAARG